MIEKGTVVYFGTDGCPGHFAHLLSGSFGEREDKRKLENWLDRVDGRDDLRGFWPTLGTFATINFDCGTLFGCCLSPDDERGASKTWLYVHGQGLTEQQMVALIKKYPFANSNFERLCKKYKLTLPPLVLNGVQRIEKERQRQIEREGFDASNDKKSSPADFMKAAVSYINSAYISLNGSSLEKRKESMQECWPETWDKDFCKPSEDIKRDLVKAGALIAAAIDRILNE